MDPVYSARGWSRQDARPARPIGHLLRSGEGAGRCAGAHFFVWGVTFGLQVVEGRFASGARADIRGGAYRSQQPVAGSVRGLDSSCRQSPSSMTTATSSPRCRLHSKARDIACRPTPTERAALDGLKTNPPDLAIFDIKMPRMDGMELLRRLRQKSESAGHLPDLQGRGDRRGVRAQDGRRRFHPQAVLAAAARRARQGDPAPRQPKEAAAQKESEAKIIERGLLKIDPERHTCTWKNEPVTLTVTEFLILQALATRPGVVKSRNALMDAAYDDQVYVDDRTIDSHIKRLRKKFKRRRRRVRNDRNALRCRLSVQRGVRETNQSEGKSDWTRAAGRRQPFTKHVPGARSQECAQRLNRVGDVAFRDGCGAEARARVRQIARGRGLSQ